MRQLRRIKRKPASNERGLATLEAIPLLVVFVFLIAYSLGGFGIIHTAIMHSISARAYAFETFRNRANVTYFRDIPSDAALIHYREHGNRLHGVMSETRRNDDMAFRATERPIRVGITIEPGPSRNDLSIHNTKIHEDVLADGKRNQNIEVGPAWIMIQYGICLNARCGG
jgi:hypothetical protein